MSNETVLLLLPEIILVLCGTLVYLGGAFFPAHRGWSFLAAAAILVAGVALYQQGTTEAGQAALVHGNASGPITIDWFSTALRYGVLAVGLVFVLIASRWSEQAEASEFMGSLLMIVAGLMLVALANDLVLLFVGLELISIPTYVILFLGRGTNLLESGTKYFFLSVLSSALMLYGFSFLYGAAGSTSLIEIQQTLADPAAKTPLVSFARLALVLIFAGLAFRLTAVPFHFYAPDVYQGTTNPNAGLLAVVPKIAALAALVRIVYVAMPGLEELGWQLALAVSMVTMTLGNLLALWQSNVRRLMAYSSIAHAGYMLIGLAVGFAVVGGAAEAENFDGVGAMLFYLLVYVVATAGTFAALTYLSSERRAVNSVDELAGLSSTYPKTAAAIAVFMFSLTGLPSAGRLLGQVYPLYRRTGRRRQDSRSRQSLALVSGAGDRRRGERGHLGRLLFADRRRDVLSAVAGSARGARRQRPGSGHGAVRAAGAGHRLFSGATGRVGQAREPRRPRVAGRSRPGHRGVDASRGCLGGGRARAALNFTARWSDADSRVFAASSCSLERR